MKNSIFVLLSVISFIILSPFSMSQQKVMLGIDNLASQNFEQIRGKRVGLLTHPAGVNNKGRSTVDVLRGAKNVRLVALFGPEHGIYGNEKADVPVLDKIDKRTGLPVYSLYGKYRKPTPQMLSKIDVLVIDLQDVGSRSYTYVSCMLRAMEACFENGKEVVILDRPNPLGGIKVDGPPLDSQFKSYVGMFQVPYVHGLTIGELARWAKNTSSAMEITSKAQRNGKLTVVPMKGWKRSMMWSDTNLKWVPTSPAIPSAAAAVGYSMTGLGCQLGGFQHGYGTQYPFRFLTYPNKSPVQIQEALKRFNIKGVSYKPAVGKASNGKEVEGLYIIVTDWNALRNTEISFYLMKLACQFSGENVFRKATNSQGLLFNKHTGSEAWWNEIYAKGANANVAYFINKWQKDNAKFKADSTKYHLY